MSTTIRDIPAAPREKWIRNPSHCTMYRRRTTTKHEMNMQLPPVASQVSEEVMHEYRKILGSFNGCVYCGSRPNTWDHVHPLVTNGMPSGIVPTQIELLPCCSACNSSKGKKTWQAFMYHLKRKKKHNPSDHDHRCAVLAQYDTWREQNEQRWNVHEYEQDIRNHYKMVDEFHAFMQYEINKLVQRMHGSAACTFKTPKPTFDFTSMRAQLRVE